MTNFFVTNFFATEFFIVAKVFFVTGTIVPFRSRVCAGLPLEAGLICLLRLLGGAEGGFRN